jgi:hypothetical protein
MPTKPMPPPFRSVVEAYEHFKQDELKRGYAPWDERRDGEWVVVYFKETHVVRCFPTLESVADWYAWSIYGLATFLSAAELSARFPTPKLQELHAKLSGPTDLVGLELAEACWKLCQVHGTKMPRVRSKGLARSTKASGYTFHLQKMLDPAGQTLIEKLPKQARVIGQEFAKAGQTTYTEEELRSFGRQLTISGKLKTKQDPYRIIAYYAPTLADLGFLEYPGRRKSEPDMPPEFSNIDPEAVSE